jgi:hypothetical protein
VLLVELLEVLEVVEVVLDVEIEVDEVLLVVEVEAVYVDALKFRTYVLMSEA